MALSVLKSPLRNFFCNLHGHLTVKQSFPRFEIRNFLLRTKVKNTYILRFCSSGNKMVTIVFEKSDGTRLERAGKIGETVQQIIGKNNPDFPGYGECDGTVSCSCCHVILSKEDFDKFAVNKKIKTKEEDLILSASIDPTPTSRLGCCLTIEPSMDGMVLKLPAVVKDLKQM